MPVRRGALPYKRPPAGAGKKDHREAEKVKIYDCRVNHLENPLGFDLGEPVFTWKGGAARLRIALDREFSNVLWDSGNTPADPLFTRPPLALKPRTRYFWRAGDGPVCFFETAKLDEPWKARWVGCDSGQPRHPIFSKRIAVRGPVASARLYICGLGLYEARIDGVKVGDEHLTPFFNDYHRWLQYQTWDVTHALSGGGTLSVELGNGWYAGRFSYWSKPGDRGLFGDGWKLLAEVRVRYADGTEDVTGTDETWQVTRGRITASSIYDGEHWDMTLPETAPEPALPAPPPEGVLRARLSPPVAVRQELSVRQVLHTPAGETVLDLGQNMTGIFRARVRIPRGQTLRLQFGEHLEDGNFYRENLRTALQEFVWVSDGEEHVVEPRFTFYGYRYVKVEGAELGEDSFTALVLHSRIWEIGSLTTGDRRVDRLIANTVWGQRGNYLDVPTDCPQRDERMGWTGDAQVFAPTACYFTDCTAFLHKFLTDMNYEQSVLGGMVPYTVPHLGQEKASTAWGDAATVIPWTLYMFTGDRSILEDHFDGMAGWTSWCAGRYDRGTWLSQFHFGDWLSMDEPIYPDPRRGGTDAAFIACAYLIHSARLTAAAARVIGRDPSPYEAVAGRVLADVRRDWFDAEGACRVNTQTAHLLTLAFDLHPDRERAKNALLSCLDAAGGKLQTGFVGTPLLCPVLSRLGLHRRAYDLLLNEDIPSWLYEVKMGATTVWERWDSVLPDGHMGDTGMNSLNHYAYGSVCEWIWRYAAGIEPAEPGFRSAALRPAPDRRLQRLDAVYDSAAGRYEVHWRYEGEKLLLDVLVPEGCRAELTLPGGGSVSLSVGAASFVCPG